MPDLTTSFKFGLEIDNVNFGFFRKVTGLGSKIEVIEHEEVNSKGVIVTIKHPGKTSWEPLSLDRRLDTSHELWLWHKQVLDGDIDKARRNGSVVAYDSTSKEVGRWNFDNGWPCEWKGAAFDASTNEVATESVTITHEGLVRA